MARKTDTTTVSIPTTFVGTFYDVNAGIYVASRKDGTLTVGRIGSRGLNVTAGLVAPDARGTVAVER